MQAAVLNKIMIGFLSTKLTCKSNGHLACGQLDAELDLGPSQIKPPVRKREVQTRTRLRAAIWQTILYVYDLHIITSSLIQYNTIYHMQVLFELKCLMKLLKSLVLLCVWRKSIHFNKRSKVISFFSYYISFHISKWKMTCRLSIHSLQWQHSRYEGKKYLLKTALF